MKKIISHPSFSFYFVLSSESTWIILYSLSSIPLIFTLEVTALWLPSSLLPRISSYFSHFSSLCSYNQKSVFCLTSQKNTKTIHCWAFLWQIWWQGVFSIPATYLADPCCSLASSLLSFLLFIYLWLHWVFFFFLSKHCASWFF